MYFFTFLILLFVFLFERGYSEINTGHRWGSDIEIISDQMEKEILLEIDTKALIDSNKLESDCSDLKFVREQTYGEFEELDMWIEQGCNSEKTKVWVRLNNEVNKVNITMLYGLGDFELSDEHSLSMEGDFLFLKASNDDCMFPVEDSIADLFNLQNNSAYIRGTTNSQPLFGGSSYHTHQLSPIHFEQIIDTDRLLQGDLIGSAKFTLISHQHEYISNSTIIEDIFWDDLLGWVQFKLCGGGNISVIPKHFVAFLESKENFEKDLFQGWMEYNQDDINRYIKIGNTFSRSSHQQNDSLVHDHKLDGKLTLSCGVQEVYSLADEQGDTDDFFSTNTHTHVQNFKNTITPTTFGGEIVPPYHSLFVIEKETTNSNVFPDGIILPFIIDGPPIGWKHMKEYDNVFLRFNTNQENSTTSSFHSHSFTVDFPIDEGGYKGKKDANALTLSQLQHNHSVTFKMMDVESIPNYVNIKLFQKNSNNPKMQIIYGEEKKYSWTCNGIDKSSDTVCNGNGVCNWNSTGIGVCVCNKNSYGEYCVETIPKTGKYQPDQISGSFFNIEIDYNITILGLKDSEHYEEMGNSFDCSLIISRTSNPSLFNSETDNPQCTWERDPTSLLRTSKLIIQGLDKENEIAFIKISPIKATGEVEVKIDKYTSDALSLIWLFVSIGVGVGVVVSVAVVIFIAVLVIISANQGKKLKKLSIIDVDIVLEEQKAEENGSIATLKINKKLFEVNPNDIKVEKKIGEGGGDAVVFQAQFKGQIVAYKVFNTSDVCVDQHRFDSFEKEVKILSSVSHPYIVQFLGASLNPPRVGIVMEFCPNGDLKHFCLKSKSAFNLFEKQRCFKEIASALNYLHSKKIIHRDMKSENVLVDKNTTFKIMDFGLSKLRGNENKTMTKRIGTGSYMAPEVVEGKKYDEKCDVYSYGIILWEVIHGDFNPYGKKSFQIENQVAKSPNFRPDINESKVEGETWLISLMKRCWQHDPNLRPTFSEVLKTLDKRKTVQLNPDNFEDISKEINKQIIKKEIEDLKKKLKEMEIQNQSLKKELKMLNNDKNTLLP